MTDHRTNTAPQGYELILPPEWARIPMRAGTKEAVRAIVDDAFAGLPADTPPDRVGPYRRELERRLNNAVEEARRAETLDLYLPLERRLLEAPGRAAQTSSVEVDNVPGVRTERTAQADQDGSELASRRVAYVVPVPEDPGRWVSVVFSTVGAGRPDDELSDLFVELFDAMMSTFRWSRS